jgi:hypothetical protein
MCPWQCLRVRECGSSLTSVRRIFSTWVRMKYLGATRGCEVDPETPVTPCDPQRRLKSRADDSYLAKEWASGMSRCAGICEVAHLAHVTVH